MSVCTECGFSEAAPSLGLSLLSCSWLSKERSRNLTVFCCMGRYSLLICSLWMQNCKATFLGMEPRALEEGHTFKTCFLSSFPSIGSRSKPGNSSAVLGPFLPMRSHRSPPCCLVSAGSIVWITGWDTAQVWWWGIAAAGPSWWMSHRWQPRWHLPLPSLPPAVIGSSWLISNSLSSKLSRNFGVWIPCNFTGVL